MSDEMPEVIYAQLHTTYSGIFKCGNMYLEGDTKYISQASSNQAVRDALDEFKELLIFSKVDVKLVNKLAENLKSKYEGE